MAQKIKIENARIIFRNFSGRPTDWNKKGGVRDFHVVLDTYEGLQSLIDMGFKIKTLKKRNEEDPDIPILKVKVNFRYNDDGSELLAPHIYMVNPSTKKKTLITPATAPVLDAAEIAFSDIYITPYRTTVQGENYVTAYLDKMYVNLEVDDLEDKYSMYDDDVDVDAEEIPFE